MTKYLSRIALAALVAFAGCSGDSPSPSNPAPPGGSQATWAISSLTLSDSQPYVGSVVSITATVTKDGNPAPDGTTVEFTALNTGVEPLLKATEDGVAAFGFTSSAEGSFVIRARVNTASRTVTVTFIERNQSDKFIITGPLVPNQGAYDGNEQVIINGKAVTAPVEVDFIVGTTTFPALVETVNESDPIESAGSITLRTPYITDADRTQSSHATVVVRVGVNTGSEQTAQVPDGFTYLAEAALWIYQPFDPNTGSYDGGETITLRGRGIAAPAEVVFTLKGQDFAGIVQEVVESVPSSADGTIVVQTPYIPEDFRVDGDGNIVDQVVDVKVTVRAQHADAQSTTVPSAFIFTTQGSELRPYWDLDEPFFYLVLPDHGASSGGETVTILGRNLRAEYMDVDGQTVLDTAPAVKSVTFGGVEGVVQTVSADGTQATVLTPRYSTLPLTEDTPVTVVVTTEYEPATLGPYTASITDAYVFLADEPTPVITGLAPIAGPVDGGTRVTIFGSGFQVPAQVTFGGLEALGVEVHDDQSLADQDTIVCITPDYSQQGATIPLAVDVIVRNVVTGKVSEPEVFTYGDNLYISDNTPTQGGPGTNIIIYGAGFEDPLTVEFTGGALAGNRLEVLSVSGTEILARIPVDTPAVCASSSTAFTITLLESGRVASGGSFTYLGNNPQIFGIDPIFVQETAGGDGVVPDDIVINGDFFSDDLIVEVQSFRIANNDIDVESENRINVRRIPAPNEFDLVWDFSTCVTDTGLTGIRKTATPVDVTVINLPGNCSDTLAGGLVYEPQEPVICEVAPLMEVTAPDFDPTQAGDCSTAVPLTIQNIGGGTLEVTGLTVQGPFPIDSAPPLPFTVDPFTFNTDVMLTFCPVTDNGEIQPGQIIIISNNPTNPFDVGLSGQEAFPILSGPTDGSAFGFDCFAGNICTADIFVNNSGTADLTWSTSNFTVAELTVIASSQPAPPGGSGTITVQLDASLAASGDSFSGDLTITPVETDAQGGPVTVLVTGNVL